MASAQMMVSPNVQRKADELLARSDRWARGYRKADGLAFVVFASQSAPGVYYQTKIDGEACTCPAARLSRTGQCCHRVAVTAAYHEARNRPYRTYSELFGDDDDMASPF